MPETKDPTKMTHKQIVERQTNIAEELERLSKKADESEERSLSDEDETYWDELKSEYGALNVERKAMERDADLREIERSKVAKAAEKGNTAPGDGSILIDADPQVTRENGRVRYKNPYDLSEIRQVSRSPVEVAAELRGRALSAVETMVATTDKRKQTMTELIERWDDEDSGSPISRLALAISEPAYVRAFARYIKNSGNLSTLDPEDQRVVSRAMSTTTTAGGFLIPFQLDPTVINTADGSFNQVRQISRTVVATGNKWHGVSSAGVTGHWTNEEAQATDGSATFAQPSIDIHKLTIFVPISIEAAADAANVAQEVGTQIAFEKDVKESQAFVTGDGSGKPRGVVHRLAATTDSKVDTNTDNTFVVGDVYALDNALPARYRFNATWLGHRRTYNTTRQFDTQGGSNLWVQLRENVPANLLGRPIAEAEAMASGTAAAAGVLAYGDFSNYVIADRIGTTVEFIPHLFGANQRPTGQRGWYAYARVGADVVNPGAFRLLMQTSA